jgi:acyl-CoA oxidase
VIERLFARQIAQVIGDFVSRGDDDDLLVPDDQLDLFRWREGHITASAAQRFKRGLDDGHEPFEVFRAVQNHAVSVAHAHMATVLLEAFQRAVAGCQDEDLRGVLKLLCDLYALADLESDRAFFMEHGRLSGPRCKALTREVNRLCNDARLCAGSLVDAFGIPDEVLGAPIGLTDDGETPD